MGILVTASSGRYGFPVNILSRRGLTGMSQSFHLLSKYWQDEVRQFIEILDADGRWISLSVLGSFQTGPVNLGGCTNLVAENIGDMGMTGLYSTYGPVFRTISSILHLILMLPA